METRSPEEIHYQGLYIVIRVMGNKGKAALSVLFQVKEPFVAQISCGLLHRQSPFLRIRGGVDPLNKHVAGAFFAQTADETRIAFTFRSSQCEVAVHQKEIQPGLLAKFAEDHGIEPPANRYCVAYRGISEEKLPEK